MDTLPQVETFLSHNLIITLLILELIALFIIVLTVIVKHILTYFSSKTDKISKGQIFYSICEGLQGNPEAALEKLRPYADSLNLLNELEAFNERLSSHEWEILKNKIIEQYLRPQADKWISSKSWVKRNFTARVMALSPRLEDEPLMLRLLEDPIFLVRCQGAKALAHLKTSKGTFKLIEHMCQEFGYAHYFYRDLLIENDTPEEFLQLEKLTQEEIVKIKSAEKTSQKKDESFLLGCLDILAARAMSITTPVLHEALELKSLAVDRAVMKVYAKNPQMGSEVILLNGIKDPDDEIRLESAEGLEHFDSSVSLEALEKALHDAAWRVRLAAAVALRNRGPSGHKTLRNQQERGNRLAWETAQYALQFD